MNVALPLVAPSTMNNPHQLSRRTRLLLWLLSMRPDVDGMNLVPTRQYLNRCLQAPSKRG
jgi:hypothetical protein